MASVKGKRLLKGLRDWGIEAATENLWYTVYSEEDPMSRMCHAPRREGWAQTSLVVLSLSMGRWQGFCWPPLPLDLTMAWCPPDDMVTCPLTSLPPYLHVCWLLTPPVLLASHSPLLESCWWLTVQLRLVCWERERAAWRVPHYGEPAQATRPSPAYHSAQLYTMGIPQWGHVL